MKKWTKWNDIGIKETILTCRFYLIQVREEIDTGEKQFKRRLVAKNIHNLSGVTIPKDLTL